MAASLAALVSSSSAQHELKHEQAGYQLSLYAVQMCKSETYHSTREVKQLAYHGNEHLSNIQEQSRVIRANGIA